MAQTTRQLNELEECILESANAGKPIVIRDGKLFYILTPMTIEKDGRAIPDDDLGRVRGGLQYELGKGRLKKPFGDRELEQIRGGLTVVDLEKQRMKKPFGGRDLEQIRGGVKVVDFEKDRMKKAFGGRDLEQRRPPG